MPEPNQPQLSLSAKDLQALISAAVTAAVKEAKKPYVDEALEARKLADRNAIIAEENQRIANVRAAREYCPHINDHGRPNFRGQRLCTGQWMILCQTCTKVWLPGDAGYDKVFPLVKQDLLGQSRN